MAVSPDAKCADPTLSLDVDEMILDYLLSSANKALLDECKARRAGREPFLGSGADLPLSMVDGFLTIFKLKHTTDEAPAYLRFRLSLLKFTNLFIRRLYPSSSTPPLQSLERLRQKNRRRADTWYSHTPPCLGDMHTPPESSLDLFTTTFPLPQASLDYNRTQVLTRLGVPPTSEFPSCFYGTPSGPSLLDTLPSFMALSAEVVRFSANQSISGPWINMACEYMVQAVIEQYLICGAQGLGALREAFAWGLDERDEGGEESVEQVEVNAMFFQEQDEGRQDVEMVDAEARMQEVRGWKQARAEHFLELIPPSPASAPPVQPSSQPLPQAQPQTAESHLQTLSSRHPVDRFENAIVEFLFALQKCQAPPILTQLESGKVEGLSRAETQALKARVGFTSGSW